MVRWSVSVASINGAATIPTPAPAGGVTVTLTSNPTVSLTLCRAP